MKPATVVLAVFIAFCGRVDLATHEVGPETANSCSQSHGELFATLVNARGIVTPTAMYETEGDAPRILSAFQCLVSSPTARTDMDRLLEEGTTSGQVWALIALKVLDPEEFALRIPRYLRIAENVQLLGGDVVAWNMVSEVSRHIQEGHFSVLLPRSVYVPVEPFTVFEKVK